MREVSGFVFEMICLSGEIKTYIGKISTNLGLTFEEGILLNALENNKNASNKILYKKMNIDYTIYFKTLELLKQKGYINPSQETGVNLSEKGEKISKQITNEMMTYFSKLLVQEEIKPTEISETNHISKQNKVFIN